MSTPQIAVIAAAGKGQRIHPRNEELPKVMLDVGGRPLLTRHLERVRDMGIRKVYIIIGYLGERIRAAYGDGSQMGLDITYIDNPEVKRGLGTALLVTKDYVREPFLFILGDELYLNTNLKQIVDIAKPYVAVCSLHRTEDRELIRKNYSVALEGARIASLDEKPEDITSPYIGCGAFLFSPEIFQDAYVTSVSSRTGKLELIDIVAHAAERGAAVLPFFLEGQYININTIEDLNRANFLCRDEGFERQRVSLIIPAYNEAAAIGHVIRDFKSQVDEIIVMDNCSTDGTAQVSRDMGVSVHSKPLRGYGDALKQGMDAASGDILVLVEADATFRSKDLGKMLEYLKDADMVIGTRTTRQMIEQGANMDGFLRWGNVVVGKLLELLWWNQEPRFTDVGCTYRAIWRDAYLRIRKHLSRYDAAFSPEMMIEMLRIRGRLIEIPISYYQRRGGASKHSSSHWHSIRTGLTMLQLIIRKRFNLA